jgi:SAM-dependent methyltransferase
MRDFWNDRYSGQAYAYGIEPNEYLQSQLDRFKKGNILFPAEGEGRNAVYAARLGWQAHAFDISEEGQKKAERLADEQKVYIDYKVCSFTEYRCPPEYFDMIGLFYTHFAPDDKVEFFERIKQWLEPGGIVLMEVFSKDNLNYRRQNPGIGGPEDPDQLYSIEEIWGFFDNFEIVELEQREIQLQEGLYHNGTGSVIRFIGQKK